ncbi:cation:proton antiporter [Nocardia callitridis]|uniref:Cation/H+ exchanger transmembrane domain-containing protein n=1 Tax=Nocardia callitridis TaxID=648753 RepID=A0ABP9KD88_9NOCA
MHPTPAALIGEHAMLVLLLQVVFLLAAAVLLGKLANRIGLPNIVGELVAGVVLGPSILGAAAPAVQEWLFPAVPTQQNLLDAIGQIGILLLVGLSAAQLDLTFVRRRAKIVAGVSGFAFVIPLALGIGIGFLAPSALIGGDSSPVVFALFTGTVLSVSAIPVIAKTLTEMRLLHRNVGQLTLASGTVDDALGWLLLSVTGAMATVGARAGNIAITVLSLVGVILVALLVLRPLARKALTAVGAREPNAVIAIVVALVLGYAAITQALHLEAILGAFFAGLVIGNRHGRPLAPLFTVVNVVFAPLFLATAGLRVDLRVLGDPAVALSAVVVLIVAVAAKFVGAYLGAMLVRLPRWEAVALGAGLNARGAVEIVIAMTGLRLGVLNTASYTVVVFVAVVTSVMAPPLLRVSMRKVDHDTEEDKRAELAAEWDPSMLTERALADSTPDIPATEEQGSKERRT